MAITNTTNKELNVIGIGDAGWGPPLNSNANILDDALGKFNVVAGTGGNETLTLAQYQGMCLKSSEALFTANVSFLIPDGVRGQWVVMNRNTGGSFDLRIRYATLTNFLIIPNGEVRTVYGDGTNVFFADTRETIPNMEIAPGAVVMFARNTAPSGWLKANGAAVSRTTYADLFAAIGTVFGAGNGSTTFNVPELRGEFLRSWADGRSVDTGRVFGSTQSDAIRNITGTFSTGANAANFSGAFEAGSSVSRIGGSPDLTGNRVSFDASNVVPTAAENRVRNVALLACIKY
jgi:microcystin-dependent protein